MGQNKSNNSKKLPPFLLWGGILLLAAFVLEFIRINMFTEAAKQNAQTTKRESSSVFDNLHKNYPKAIPAPKKNVAPLISQKVEIFSHNFTQGEEGSPVTMVIFHDDNCTACRLELKNILRIIKPYENDIKIAYKFMPIEKQVMEGGIFFQIAKKYGIAKNYQQVILNHPNELNYTDYLQILENLGISLDEQRTVLRKDMNLIIRNLEKDIAQAENLKILGKDIPVIYLNGFRLGQNYLPTYEMPRYIENILNDMPINYNELNE